MIQRPSQAADADWQKLQTIRLRDALQKQSGFAWKVDPRTGNPVHSTGADMLLDGIKLPMAEKPGTKHIDSDFDAALVGFAIGDLTGQNLPDAAQSLLYDKLQISKVSWDFKDRVGRYSGGFGARLRPMDMLKIGQIYLQGGRWNDTALLSADFVKQVMPMDGPHEGRFNLMWFAGKNPDVGDLRFFYGGGRKTQRIYVFPEWDMVVAVVASMLSEDDQAMLRPFIRSLKGVAEGGPVDLDAIQKLEALTATGFNGSRTAAEGIDAPRKADGR